MKEKLKDNHGVVVNFSDGHDNYYTAYRYVTKQDAEVYHSVGHPNLNEIGSPKTKNCIRAYRSARKKRSLSIDAQEKNAEKKKPGKVRCLNNLEVSEFITENNVKGYTKLLALAEAQKMEGEKDLANFILCRTTKAVEELIETTWRMKKAQTNIDRKKMSRMQLVRNARNGQCVKGCNRQWIECAHEVLKNNNIHPVVFYSALKELLTKGRGKFRNVLLVGCACSGKTFLFDPLCAMFKTFVNPLLTSMPGSEQRSMKSSTSTISDGAPLS